MTAAGSTAIGDFTRAGCLVGEAPRNAVVAPPNPIAPVMAHVMKPSTGIM
jgi:hypothetical protein